MIPINEYDNNLIQKYFKQGVCANHQLDNSKIEISSNDILLENWNIEKSKYLYKLLGDNLIISKEINYNRNVEDFRNLHYENLLRYNNFCDIFYETIIENKNKFKDISNILGYRNVLEISLFLFSALNLYHNKNMLISHFVIFSFDGTIFTIDNKVKITKVIKKLSKMLGLEKECDEWLLEYSRVMNDKNIYGELCLSIHPLDYATLSDNDSGWNSCVSWKKGGEYIQGTLELMNSPCVVVAYLKSAKPYFPIINETDTWNNKKWRELFIITPEIIQGVKGYPYEHFDLEKIVAEWLKELAKTNLNWKYESKYKPYVYRSKEDNFKFKTLYMYNDFKSRAVYHRFDNGQPISDITYTGKPLCLICGSTNKIDNSEELFCYECYCKYKGYKTCENCGGIIYSPYSYNNKYYCYKCADLLFKPL